MEVFRRTEFKLNVMQRAKLIALVRAQPVQGLGQMRDMLPLLEAIEFEPQEAAEVGFTIDPMTDQPLLSPTLVAAHSGRVYHIALRPKEAATLARILDRATVQVADRWLLDVATACDPVA